MRKLNIDEVKELLGEGLHKALRVMGDSFESQQAYNAIENMNRHEWDNVLNYVALALEDGGVSLVSERSLEPTGKLVVNDVTGEPLGYVKEE